MEFKTKKKSNRSSDWTDLAIVWLEVMSDATE